MYYALYSCCFYTRFITMTIALCGFILASLDVMALSYCKVKQSMYTLP